MTREEIMVQLGIDSASMERGLMSARSKVDRFGQSVANTIKGAFGYLAAGFSVAGAVAVLTKVFDKVEEIKRASETLGISTDLVQDLHNIAGAAGIAAEKVDSAMGVFVRKLAPGSDVEQSLNEVADRLAGIEDPGERARLAVEAFGKSGLAMIPVLQDGSRGLRELAAAFATLSESEIEDLDNSKNEMEKWGNWVTVWAGKSLASLRTVGTWMKNWWEAKTDPAKGNPYTYANQQTEKDFWDEQFGAGDKADAKRKATAAAAKASETAREDEARKKYQDHLDDLKLRTGTAEEKTDILNRRLKEQLELVGALAKSKDWEKWADASAKAADIQSQMADGKPKKFNFKPEMLPMPTGDNAPQPGSDESDYARYLRSRGVEPNTELFHRNRLLGTASSRLIEPGQQHHRAGNREADKHRRQTAEGIQAIASGQAALNVKARMY